MTRLRSAPTRKQREILEFIRDYWGRHSYGPTFQEVADHFGYSSLSTVHEHAENLRRKKLLKRVGHNEARSLVPAGDGCPACGASPADRGDVAGIITGQKLRMLEEAGFQVVRPEESIDPMRRRA